MKMPILNVPGNRYEKRTLAFRGVYYGEGGGEGQLEECRNLSSARFPALSPRVGRTEEGSYESATAVFFKGNMLVVDGTKLLYDGVEIADVSEGQKQIASVNSKAVIFPDKICYDTETGEVRSLEASFFCDAGPVEFLDGCKAAFHLGNYSAAVLRSGNKGGSSSSTVHISERDWPFEYKLSGVSVNSDTGAINFGSTARCVAKDVSVGMLFVDSSLGADGVNTWGAVTKIHKNYDFGIWFYGFDYDILGVQGTSYSDFSGLEGLGFRVGDTVEFSGCTTYPEHNKSCTIREFGTYTTSDGTELPTMIFDKEMFSGYGVEEGSVSVRRKVPNMTVICESSNRLWGAEGNTIYASALGDPTNFFTYDGLDTDSWAVPVVSEGDFTGCIGYGTGVLFFKEDRLYKILGSYPSQYTMYDYTVPGVKKGSEKSLKNINEVMYYHGREGIYRYSGGSPELITENFGLRRFTDASAGSDGERYYVSMKDRDSQEWGLWSCDIRQGIWLQEDGLKAVDFACNAGKLYCAAGDGRILLLNPDDSEEEVLWSATTCRIDETYLNRKCYSRLLLRLEVAEGAWVQAEISHDGGPWQTVYTGHGRGGPIREIPIMPRRCDSFRVRLSGAGETIVRSMVREYRMVSTAR